MRGDFQVGGFLVEPALGRISCGEAVERLPPKAMDVLVALTERPGDLWTKDELMDRVWPDQYVGDDVLANAVYELRRAFGDDARDPRFIETVHRRGYRLIAELEPRDDDGRSESPGGSATGPETDSVPTGRTRGAKRWRRAVTWLVLPVALAGVAVLTIEFWGRESLSASVVDVQVDGSPQAADLEAILGSALRRELGDSSLVERPRLFRRGDVPVSAYATIAEDRLEVSALLDCPRYSGERMPVASGSAREPVEVFRRLARAVRLELELCVLDDGPLRHAVVDSGTDSLAAYRAYERGLRLAELQDYEQAVEAFGEAIRLDGRFLDAYEKLARIQDNRGYVDKAREVIERAIRIAAADPEVEDRQRWWLELRRARIEGDVREQVRLVEDEILADSPYDPTGLLNQAWIFIELLRDCDKALRASEDLARVDQSDYVERHRATVRFLCDETPDAALAMLEGLVAEDPEAVDLDKLASYQLFTGRLDEAAATLDARDRLEAREGRDFISLQPLRGMLAMARGRYWEALAAIVDYGDPLGPNFRAAAAHRRGEALLALGKPSEALEAQKATLLEGAGPGAQVGKPDAVPNRWIVGLAHLELGDVAAAETERERIRQYLEPLGSHYQREYLHHLEGRIHEAHGRPGEAAESFERALAERPRDRAFFHHAMARALGSAGLRRAAETTYRQALAFNPSHFPSLCDLGTLLAETRRRDEAQPLFERCLEVLGEDNRQEPRAETARRALAGEPPVRAS